MLLVRLELLMVLLLLKLELELELGLLLEPGLGKVVGLLGWQRTVVVRVLLSM